MTGSAVSSFSSLKRIALLRRRRRIPVVMQLALSDCGAAALAMVLEYHGKVVPLDDLRNTLSLGRDGTNAAALIRAGRLHGLSGRGVRLEIEDLHNLPIGAILYWEFRHFVVLEGLRRSRVDVVDPASGRRSIPMAEFRRAFTGVALIFEPTDSFEPGGSKPRKISGFLKQVLQQRDLVARILSSSLLAQILAAAAPLLTGVVIDRVIPHKDYSLLLVLVVGYCVFQSFNVLASFIRAHLLIYLKTELEARFTLRFLDHLVNLPYSFFQQHTSGDLLVRLGSNNTIRDILTSAVLSAFLDGTMTAVYLGLLFVANVQLTLVVIALALARFMLLIIVRWRQRQLLTERLENQSHSQTYQVEMLSGMETLKAMGLEQRAVENWSNLFVDGLNISIKLGKLDAAVQGLLSLLGTATTLAFLFYGAFLVLNGALTLGTMMAFSALAAGFLAPMNDLVAAALQLQMIEVYVARLNDVMEKPPEQEIGAALLCRTLTGEAALERVSFRYSTQGPLVVDDVSIELHPGSRVALVGRSGSGKSTLARLIAGLYEPISGRVLFDGNDLKALDRRSVRNQLGVVTQDAQLFSGSIRGNIALADPQMALDRIVRVAKLAGIHDEIMAMPMGYETHLGDRGLSLSGGQRQRLAIARALACNPVVLVLDEATSHLDAITEERVNRALAGLRCTRIVIAHRLSTIRDADLILVLESGKVVEKGTHERLLSMSGTYANLLAAQRDGVHAAQAV